MGITVPPKICRSVMSPRSECKELIETVNLQHGLNPCIALHHYVQGAYQSSEGVIKVLNGKADVWVAYAGLLFLGALPFNIYLRHVPMRSDCDLLLHCT